MRRAQIRESNRQALIAAAIAEIGERGYQAAKLGDIAERAGLTTGAVYSNFGGKKDLLVAAWKQLIEQFRETLTPLSDPQLDLTEVLRRYTSTVLGSAAEGRAHELFAFELAAMAAAIRDPKLLAHIDSEVPQGLPVLIELLTDHRIGSGAGHRRTTKDQAARLAPAVDTLVKGFAQHAILGGTNVDRDYVVDCVIALTALID
ncbi:TetR/AcrR family transcriptional regulator [Nocardia transvalensis]|uniref:TetR/AcrR family transcriptional regulator n=1 Tax=Nocardia transvalensis TaxID=37333 RepID=UPI001894217F|nr:TetR/AcrR family transcriptional regulator [Nocardia transvalensis]MBF6327910.1 TetR/AcrR family transcriptional regulator [Nocardia transvalensis]